MKKLGALLLALMIGLSAVASAETVTYVKTPENVEFYEEMPPALRVTQTLEIEKVEKDITIRRAYPSSSNAQVDAQIRALVDELVERNRASLPHAAYDRIASLDVGAVISRTGTSWMSFLTQANLAQDREEIGVDFEARVYDMETGERIFLTDVFAPESEAWEVLAQAVREQLSAAYPKEEPDAAALDALCSRESLENANFTLGGARLMLTYRADAVYPGKNTLLHVILYYPQIRPMMTQRAQAQTDNSRFRMVALTYDDGGARALTRGVLDALRNYGAQATFFIIGKNIRFNHEYMVRQQNSGCSMQSHTYNHYYTQELTVEAIWAEKEKMAEEMSDLIGVAPTMMRAPGGDERIYIRGEIGYPLIHWSLASGDSGNPHYQKIAQRVIGNVRDGEVVLMHDINENVANYTKRIVEDLCNRGFLCVTVEELFADAGIELVDQAVYYGTYRGETVE